MAINQPRETIEDVRALAARLLSSVEASERDLSRAGGFRYRLIRGHALAMLDELEVLARDPSNGGAPSR